MLETQADPDHIQHIETKPHFMSDEKLHDTPQKWSDRMQTFQIPISIAVADQAGWIGVSDRASRDFPLHPGSGAIPRIQTDLFIWHSDNRGTYLTHLFGHATVTPICFPCARRSHHGGVP